ncbi:MAG TPA: hypothetical protein VGJ97_13360 [Anaerolineaceae bacterium]|jgi:hypothetical protein
MLRIIKGVLEVIVLLGIILFGVSFDEQLEGLTAADGPASI